MKRTHQFLSLLFVFFFFISSSTSYPSGKRVLLKDVTTLTLQRGEYTTARRSSSIPQLNCVGGNARQYDKSIDSVQCTQTGWDGYDAQWECKADLDKRVKFGKITVSCEGYDYPDDPYVLAGSCGLEYELAYASSDQNHGNNHNNYGSHYSSSYDTGSSKVGRLILFAIVAFIFYNVYQQCVRLGNTPVVPPTAPNNGGQYWGPGGNGPHYGPGPGPGYGGGYPDNCPPRPSSNYYGGANWRPGFWSGLATGGALGHLFSRGNSYNQPSLFGMRRGGGLGGGSSLGSLATGSRMASGFGGTRRR